MTDIIDDIHVIEETIRKDLWMDYEAISSRRYESTYDQLKDIVAVGQKAQAVLNLMQARDLIPRKSMISADA